ncbi:flagellar motor switch protein FliN [Myxococcota bacterium]|nr:flagellar motor switch protein FliN [Myxococcota bacterium]
MAEQGENKDLPEIDEQVVGQGAQAGGGRGQASLAAGDLGLVLEVPLRLTVEIGSANLLVRDVLALTKGSVVELDRMSGEPADVYANDRLIARGEVSVADQRVAIRITELVGTKPRS